MYFPSAQTPAAQIESISPADSGSLAWIIKSESVNDSCCNHDAHPTFDNCSLDVPTQPTPVFLAENPDSHAVASPTGRPYRLSFSGSDPPDWGGMRLHLRWQVILI